MTNIVEPTDSKKGSGWAVSEKPPSSYFNWIHQKQDQWIQYLDWRSSLKRVVSDDFCIGLGEQIFVNPSQLAPRWYVTGNIFVFGGNGIADGVGAGIGAVQNTWSGSGFAEIRTDVGNPSARDFRMEGLLGLNMAGGSLTTAEFGLFFAHSGQSGANTQLGFVITGASGAVGFRWVPSGGTPTSVSLGAIPSGASGMHKYVVEGRNPTMAFYVDDTLRGAAPMPGAIPGAGLAPPLDLHFGVRIGGQSGFATRLVTADLLEYEVSRNPR